MSSSSGNFIIWALDLTLPNQMTEKKAIAQELRILPMKLLFWVKEWFAERNLQRHRNTLHQYYWSRTRDCQWLTSILLYRWTGFCPDSSSLFFRSLPHLYPPVCPAFNITLWQETITVQAFKIKRLRLNLYQRNGAMPVVLLMQYHKN